MGGAECVTTSEADGGWQIQFDKSQEMLTYPVVSAMWPQQLEWHPLDIYLHQHFLKFSYFWRYIHSFKRKREHLLCARHGMQDTLQYVYSLCKADAVPILQRHKQKFRESFKLRFSKLIIERTEIHAEMIFLTLRFSCYHCVLSVTFHQRLLFVGIISYEYFSVK